MSYGIKKHVNRHRRKCVVAYDRTGPVGTIRKVVVDCTGNDVLMWKPIYGKTVLKNPSKRERV